MSAQEDGFRKEFERFRREKIGEYRSFRDSVNRVYADFVRQAWEEYNRLPAVPKPEEEVVPPVVFPVPEGDQEPIAEDNPIHYETVVPIEEPAPQPLPVAPVEEVPQPVESYFHFAFYNTDCKVRLDEGHRFKLPDCSENSVADAWNSMCSGKYDNLVRDCLELRLRHKLCDWAYLQMLDSMSDAFYGKDTDESTLLTAFLYCQTGYQMRFARDNDRLVMLYSSRHFIYGEGYFNIGGTWFYPFENQSESLQISTASFPEEMPLSLFVADEQFLSLGATAPRVLRSAKYPDMNLTSSVNSNLVDFYDSYPTSCVNGDFGTRWAMYANTSLSSHARNSLYPSLKSHIEGKSQLEAVGRILDFVQTGFVYEYDDKVWGADRAFFPEETLFYPYCDCEDRSILFSRLVRDLLGLDVVLVYYPGHLATAVAFDEDVKGDCLTVNSRKYVVCDPTYIGAPVGYTMPGMDNLAAIVITL